MNLTAENTTAKNGTRIYSCVRIDFDDVGVVDYPFEVVVTANGVPKYEFHKTREAASAAREQMHTAYMETHTA